MKKLFKITAASFASIALLAATLVPTAVSTTGCALLGGGGSTNAIPQSTIDATAVLLQGAAAAGAQAAIQNDPKSAEYFSLAADSIATFLTSTNYTPGAFQNSLLAVAGTNNVLSSPYVRIGIGTVVDLYQLYFGMYVKGQVNGNAYAGEFLTAIQNGFYTAVGRPLPAGVKRKLSEGGLLLPRPLKSK